MQILTLLFLLLTPLLYGEGIRTPKKHKLSICALFRNEAPYLKEWIEFHRLVGVEHFYLINNLSHDDWYGVLKPYIDAGIVEVSYCPFQGTTLKHWNHIQCTTYNRTFRKTEKETDWLAILDTDEFLFPTHENNLRTTLKRYQQFAGVGVNWQRFGSSFVEKIPEGRLMIETLLLKAHDTEDDNRHIKSVVQPHLTSHMINPHFCFYHAGFFAVDELKQPISEAKSDSVHVDILRINHYVTRDLAFLLGEKVQRYQIWNGAGTDTIEDKFAQLNELPCDVILRFVPDLKKRMAAEKPLPFTGPVRN